MCVSNGLSSFFSKGMCLFVCLLLIMSKLKGEETNTTSSDSDNINSSYDVFFSFRGADIRKGFLSHLVEAFSRKKIFLFVDDKLPRGDEIAESLLTAIQTSLISLVIFSNDYASSRWCLDELVKIVDCRHKYGQIVIPVFYKVDPRDVRKQMGTYGIAFSEHEKKYNLTRVLAWRYALKESADISGFHSSNFLNDADLVEEIVKCVMGRLGHVTQLNAKGLIGIGKQISHVESLLQVHWKDVRAIGLWGMGGIGKTTIVEVVFHRLRLEYDRCCFMANVREELARHGPIFIKERLFSTLLGEHVEIDTPHGLPIFVERRLRRMKVLIVLDDVNDSEQLEILIGSLDWYGGGSRIIITTRDKQVIPKTVDVYEVRPLDFDESFQLFNLNAFEKNLVEMGYYELSKGMVNYAKGIPLVLKVLGQLLRGKDKKIWETQLERLKKVPVKKVNYVIALSYNDLDRDEKKIFLDIACFFDGLHLKVDDINMLIKGPDYSVDVELKSLQNKALITISRDKVVSMHNIIQETAWEIVRGESINEDPRFQSRLLDPFAIYQVLKDNKGSEATRSIAINLSMIKELQLNPQVFAKMRRLQYLDIYHKGSRIFLQNQGGLYLPQGLDSLPNELRYLRWTHYPLESLPSKFSGEKLVTLNLQSSQVKKIWNEEKDLLNLKFLILSFSSNLVELPDFSKATNLVEIDLRLCLGLTSVHPSIFSLNKLKKLDFGGCISLTSLPGNIHHLSSLRYLSLAGCKSLKEFSVTSKNMAILNLEHAGIKQLPSSIGLQTKLVKLLLAYTYIENLPESIKHLTRLRVLDLRNCRELQSLPELPSSLKTLDASGCVSLETVTFSPTSLQQQMENKIRVSFWNCLKLDEQSLKAIGLNAQINIKKFAHQHISKLGHDFNAQGTYVYPGSSVPEWMVYRSMHDYMTIDLTFSEQLGFIFCFIVPEVASQGSILRFNISVGEEDIQLYLDRPSHGIKSNHVYLIYDQGFSRYLISRVKDQPKLEIKITAESRTLTSEYVPLMQLRGFGFSPINTSQYINLIPKMEVYGPPNTPNPLLGVFYTFVLPIVIELLLNHEFFFIKLN